MVKQPQQPHSQSQSQPLIQSILQLHTMIPSTSTSYTLLLWTAIWFALCASLVKKHVDLLTVFFAFSGSFATASLLPKGYKTKDNLGIMASILSLLLLSIQRPYAALSIMMGHLAFGLWYSALHCSPSPTRVIEDAMSLAVGVVLLSIHTPLQIHNQYHPYILLWTMYKFIHGMISGPHKTSYPIAAAGISDNNNNNNNNKNKSWIIHGTQYDLSTFTHPGGKEALALGQGRDCTHLFESYHPFTTRHEIVLQKYKHTLDSIDTVTVADTKKPIPRDLFYDELKQRVYHSLQEQDFDPFKDQTAPIERVVYYCLVATALLLATIAHIQGYLLGSFFMAIFGWLIGALGHDAGHFSVSHIPLVNDVCVWGMSFLCNPIMWQHQHTYAHHSYTNQFDHDPDLHHFSLLLKVHQRFQDDPIYSWQRHPLVVFMAYTLVVFGTCVWIPIGMLRDGSLYGLVEYTDRHRPWRAFGMMAHLASYIVLVLIVPFWTASTWYQALGAVVLHVATSGLLFGMFSQINHLNESSLTMEQRHNNAKSPMVVNSWAASQVETSNNFCTDSAFWHILSNGLNLQIEHHLFPGFNHSHLHRIAPIVKATCDEYGVTYKTYNSWTEIMGATLSWLDKLSRVDEKSP